MERKRQREIAMAAVAVVIVGIAAYRVRTTVSAPAAGPASQPTAVAGRQTSVQKQQVTEVDLQALQAERPDPVGSTRNPFRFRPKPAPPPPPPAPVRPTLPVPDGPIAPPPPPRIPLKFIGIVESPRAGRLAVLSDGRGVYQGREGETIEGRYRILKIGVESIDLAYVDGRGRQTIRLTGQ